MASVAPLDPEVLRQLRRPMSWRQKLWERLIERTLLLCGLLSIAVTLAIAGVVLVGSYEFFMDGEYEDVIESQYELMIKHFLAQGGESKERVKALLEDAVKRAAGASDEARKRQQIIERMLTAKGNDHLMAQGDERLVVLDTEQMEAQLRAAEPHLPDGVKLPRARVSIWYFLTGTEWSAGFRNAKYGIIPLISGTLMVAVIAALIAMPIGLATAIYLSEYAGPRIRGVAKPTLELLAGIPTVVYGFFAVSFITPLLASFIPGLQEPYNQLSGGIVVGIMIIPLVASLSEDSLRAVPAALRDGSYALGANKFETSIKVVVPAALSGITASFILAMSRAIGETMAVSLACGDRNAFSLDPREGVATMTSFIVRIAKGDVQHGSTDFNSLFAVAATLFFMTLLMNIFAQWILKRFRQVYE